MSKWGATSNPTTTPTPILPPGPIGYAAPVRRQGLDPIPAPLPDPAERRARRRADRVDAAVLGPTVVHKDPMYGIWWHRPGMACETCDALLDVDV